MEPHLVELGHTREQVYAPGQTLQLIVEPEVGDFRPGKRRRQRAGEVVVRQPEVLQIGEGIEEVRYGTEYVGIAGVEGAEAGGLGQIGGDGPRGEAGVVGHGQCLEVGEPGEGGGGEGGEVVGVEVELLEGGEVGEGGEGAGEGVALEG